MRLLFDENLSPKMVAGLSDIFPGSAHVDRVGLGGGSDNEVWRYARCEAGSRVVPRSDRACVYTERSGVKMQALRNRVESLRNYVAYPLSGRQQVKQDGWGRRRQWLPRNFCRLLGLGCPKQAFAKIAALSKDNDFVIISKDADFYEQSMLRGQPPKVIWIRRGNCTNRQLQLILRNKAGDIAELCMADDVSLIRID
jgi:predicted nuclease of predicted toxin-antitoxin system